MANTAKSRYESWAETKVLGQIWHCGDEECDCSQAVIERISPNTDAGYPWIRRERLWEGKFYSDSWEKSWIENMEPAPEDDLADHLEEFKAVLDRDYYNQL